MALLLLSDCFPCETSGENRSTGAVSFTLANRTVLVRFWTGLDHLPEAVPFRLERFALEPFHIHLHYVPGPFRCVV